VSNGTNVYKVSKICPEGPSQLYKVAHNLITCPSPTIYQTLVNYTENIPIKLQLLKQSANCNYNNKIHVEAANYKYSYNYGNLKPT